MRGENCRFLHDMSNGQDIAAAKPVANVTDGDAPAGGAEAEADAAPLKAPLKDKSALPEVKGTSVNDDAAPSTSEEVAVSP